LPFNVSEYCDVIVDSNLGSGNYKSRSFVDETTGTLYLQGLRYLVLKKDFVVLRKSNQSAGKLKRILLIFGGSDPSNFTSRVLDELLNLGSDFDIDIVLGIGFVYDDKLNAILTKRKNVKQETKMYRDVDNVAELMRDADLVITSPGMSMLESLIIGTPTVGICQNDLQRFAYKGFMFVYDASEFFEKFESIVFGANEAFLRNQKEIKQLDIGKGKTEIIAAIIGGKN
jgi:spore coat polysaccharide biosynthesis predicted glycosyltransferase SpsG